MFTSRGLLIARTVKGASTSEMFNANAVRFANRTIRENKWAKWIAKRTRRNRLRGNVRCTSSFRPITLLFVFPEKIPSIKKNVAASDRFSRSDLEPLLSGVRAERFGLETNFSRKIQGVEEKLPSDFLALRPPPLFALALTAMQR